MPDVRRQYYILTTHMASITMMVTAYSELRALIDYDASEINAADEHSTGLSRIDVRRLALDAWRAPVGAVTRKGYGNRGVKKHDARQARMFQDWPHEFRLERISREHYLVLRQQRTPDEQRAIADRAFAGPGRFTKVVGLMADAQDTIQATLYDAGIVGAVRLQPLKD